MADFFQAFDTLFNEVYVAHRLLHRCFKRLTDVLLCEVVHVPRMNIDQTQQTLDCHVYSQGVMWEKTYF